MWSRRLFHKRIKQVFIPLAIAGFLLLVSLKTGLYIILLPGKQGHVTIVNLEKGMVSPFSGEYHLENPYKSDYSRGQSKIIDELLGGKINGFFVDIGAGDGETNSVSLFFEKERKWSGVLVESNETKHHLSVAKKRHSQLWNFRIRVNEENVIDSGKDVRPHTLFEIINRTDIDLLIVNMNGFELDLIRQINFTKYNIQVITIELQSDVSREKYLGLTSLLASSGHVAAHHLINSFLWKKDVIYLKGLH